MKKNVKDLAKLALAASLFVGANAAHAGMSLGMQQVDTAIDTQMSMGHGCAGGKCGSKKEAKDAGHKCAGGSCGAKKSNDKHAHGSCSSKKEAKDAGHKCAGGSCGSHK